MNLYLISQNINRDYDTYDSAVVAADNEHEASRLDPGNFHEWSDEHNSWMFVYTSGEKRVDQHGAWVLPSQVTVRLIGVADPSVEKGVVCASFNAG